MSSFWAVTFAHFPQCNVVLLWPTDGGLSKDCKSRFCNPDLVVSGSEWSYLKILWKTRTKPTRSNWSGIAKKGITKSGSFWSGLKVLKYWAQRLKIIVFFRTLSFLSQTWVTFNITTSMIDWENTREECKHSRRIHLKKKDACYYPDIDSL